MRGLAVLFALIGCGPRLYRYNPANGCMSVSPGVVECSAGPLDDGPRYCVSFRDGVGHWRLGCLAASGAM